jgi:cytochrome c oxidase subunit 3
MSEHPENLPPPDTRFPASYAEATGKGDIHISGAGTIGMLVLIVSLSILFAASMVAFLIVRFHYQAEHNGMWPPAAMPPLPKSLWLSTAVILVASVVVHKALKAAEREDDKGLVKYLGATMIVGVLFLLLQVANWWEFWRALRETVFQGPYLGMFYVLTGLHAAHVVGGLIPLAVIRPRAKAGRYSRNFHPGVRYAAVYWHFSGCRVVRAVLPDIFLMRQSASL